MASVTKKTDGNDAMAMEPDENDKPQPPARKVVPPSYPTNLAKGSQPGQPPTIRGTPSGSITPCAVGRRNYFTIYKKGQGYWTRMGTVAALLLIGILTANFLWEERQQMHLHDHGGYILVGIFSAIYILLGFHYLNKPGNVDFLIATDSEMKKVNWTSRKELVGSTRIVILFMVAIAIVLFLYDLFFHTFFYVLRVLQTPPPFFPRSWMH